MALTAADTETLPSLKHQGGGGVGVKVNLWQLSVVMGLGTRCWRGGESGRKGGW